MLGQAMCEFWGILEVRDSSKTQGIWVPHRVAFGIHPMQNTDIHGKDSERRSRDRLPTRDESRTESL